MSQNHYKQMSFQTSEGMINHSKNYLNGDLGRQVKEDKFESSQIKGLLNSKFANGKSENHQTDWSLQKISGIVDEAVRRNFTKNPLKSTAIESQSDKAQLKAIKTMMQPMQGPIMAKIAAHNRNIKNLQHMPSPIEAEACAKSLQKEFPTLRIDLIVKVLHGLCHVNCKQETDSSEPSQNSLVEDEWKYSTDYSRVNSTVRARQAVRMPIEGCSSEEKRIAISYLNYGYGVRVLRQYIKDPNINPTRYNNIVTTIMKLAFRRLQDFVKDYGGSIVPLNSMDEKIIRAPLVNCEKWLPPDELQTFYKFIKLACNLQSKMDIQASIAIKLYSSCIRQLRQRQDNEHQFKHERNERKVRGVGKITQNLYNNYGSFQQPELRQGFGGYSFVNRVQNKSFGNGPSMQQSQAQRVRPMLGPYAMQKGGELLYQPNCSQSVPQSRPMMYPNVPFPPRPQSNFGFH